MIDSVKPYGVHFKGHDEVFVVYPAGAVRHVSFAEWTALTEAGVPLVESDADEPHWKSMSQQSWAGRGYVYQPGD